MKRKISGVLLLDKPIGPSSNEVLQKVKRLFRAQKAGHTGSLDPGASGMLPICFGEATKFSQFLLESNKRYLVIGKLGETTASGDGETPVIATRNVGEFTLKRVEEVLNKFRGKIKQIPPMYSALKHQGQPLYKLARQGIEIAREPREVHIFDLRLLGLRDNLLHLDILCSKGTYVRALVMDIGEALGCGAHVVALRRSALDSYVEEQMVPLERLEQLSQAKQIGELDRLLLPIESMVADLPAISLTTDMLHYASCGSPILVPRTTTVGLVRVYQRDGGFRGIGEILSDGRMVPRGILNQRT